MVNVRLAKPTAVEMAGVLKTRKDEFPTPPLTTLRIRRSELLTLPQPLLLQNIVRKEEEKDLGRKPPSGVGHYEKYKDLR